MDREQQAKIIAEAHAPQFGGKDWYWEVKECENCDDKMCNSNKGETGCLSVMLKNPPKEQGAPFGVIVYFKYMDKVIEEYKQKIKSRKETEG